MRSSATALGGTLSLALMIVGATVFLGHGISPEHLGTIALGAGDPLGKIGLLLALVGILFAVGGASIDTVFSGAYNLAQFCGWEWGRYRHPKGAPRFALTWFVLLVLAMGIVMTGVDPVDADRVRGHLLGRRAAARPTSRSCSSRTTRPTWAATPTAGLRNILGLVYLVIIMIVAVSAIPLMILTNAGQN